MILSPISGINRVTQLFAENPATYEQFGLKGHNGIDLTGFTKGVLERVFSPIEGVVHEVGDQGKKGYGKYIVLRTVGEDNSRRRKEVVLAHLSKINVRQGQFVYLLDEIGIMGNTGFSTGPHLHYGLRYINSKGNVIDYNNGFKGYVDFFSYLRFWTFPPQMEAYPIIIP